MTAELDEGYRARVLSLLGDSVSPKVTIERVLLLLQRQVPVIGAYAVSLGRPGEAPKWEAGTAGLVAEVEPVRFPISDGERSYGYVDFYTADGKRLDEQDRALATWTVGLLVPLVRIHLGLDVPSPPRP